MTQNKPQTQKKRGRKKKIVSKRKELALNGGWFDLLTEDEKGKNEETGEEFVFFKGLARLAEEAGKIKERVVDSGMDTWHGEGKDGQSIYRIITRAVVEVEFEDGTIWIGSADAHPTNCMKYKMHPTAMSETRALARAYRRALGIHIVAYEETAKEEEEGVMTGEISTAQLNLISRLCTKLGLKHIDIIKSVSDRDIVSINEFTYQEGQEAARQLNEIMAKKTKEKKKGK